MRRKSKKRKDKSHTELQVDLLRGYDPKKGNLETNQLFLEFNAMAKILFVGQSASTSDFDYQAFFNLTAAGDLLYNQGNLRAAGACFMILAIKLFLQGDDMY